MVEYIYKRLFKLFNKYLEINILNRDGEVLYTEKKEYTISELLWKIKGKKLLAYEKQIIRDYKNMFKNKRNTSNSVKRGDISTSTRKAVNKRDGKKCQYCESNYNVELAHIISRGAGGEGVENNLISLCRNHHTILDNPVGEKQIKERNKLKIFIRQWEKRNNAKQKS